VTTDLGATFFMFGTLYFLWRSTRRLHPINIAGLTVFFALAMASKFTTLILAPIIATVLLLHSCRRDAWGWFNTFGEKVALTVAILIVIFFVTWGTMWAVYGFRYNPSRQPDWVFHFEKGSPFGSKFPVFAKLAVWADENRLLPNACTQGFLLGQIKAQQRGGYLAGELKSTGWWYYFPVAFLIKTPVTLLLLLLGGTGIMLFRWRRLLETPMVLLVPPAMFVGISMTQNLNIGLRHILPVYPLVILIAAVLLAWVWRRSRPVKIAGLAIVLAGMTAELAMAYPSPLAFFNITIGGPKNGDRYLLDSNLDWGQDLKGLKQWMTDHDVPKVYLCYFGTADPAYYGIDFISMPGSLFVQPGAVPAGPSYVAISVTNLRGVYFPPQLREFYAPLMKQEPVGKIGYSIYVYRVLKPWWR
jgi:hypothetical protein